MVFNVFYIVATLFNGFVIGDIGSSTCKLDMEYTYQVEAYESPAIDTVSYSFEIFPRLIVTSAYFVDSYFDNTLGSISLDFDINNALLTDIDYIDLYISYYDINIEFDNTPYSYVELYFGYYVEFNCYFTDDSSYYEEYDLEYHEIFNTNFEILGFQEIYDDYNNYEFHIEFENDFGEEIGYQEGFDKGYNQGLLESQGVNNVIDWFGSVWDGLARVLALEIAPNLTIGTIITIPIVIAVLFFGLKALIQ